MFFVKFQVVTHVANGVIENVFIPIPGHDSPLAILVKFATLVDMQEHIYSPTDEVLAFNARTCSRLYKVLSWNSKSISPLIDPSLGVSYCADMLKRPVNYRSSYVASVIDGLSSALLFDLLVCTQLAFTSSKFGLTCFRKVQKALQAWYLWNPLYQDNGTVCGLQSECF